MAMRNLTRLAPGVARSGLTNTQDGAAIAAANKPIASRWKVKEPLKRRAKRVEIKAPPKVDSSVIGALALGMFAVGVAYRGGTIWVAGKATGHKFTAGQAMAAGLFCTVLNVIVNFAIRKLSPASSDGPDA